MELLLILLQIITYSTFQCDSVFDMRLLLSLNYYKVFYRKSIEKYLKENFGKTFIKMPYVIILFKIKISILPLCNYLNKINKYWTTIPNSVIITSIGGDT